MSTNAISMVQRGPHRWLRWIRWISPYYRLALVPPNFMRLCIRGQQSTHRRNHACHICSHWFRVYGVLTPQYFPFPLTCCVALTTVYALPGDTVITQWPNCWLIVIVGVAMPSKNNLLILVCRKKSRVRRITAIREIADQQIKKVRSM